MNQRTRQGHVEPFDPLPLIEHYGPRGSFCMVGNGAIGPYAKRVEIEVSWYSFGKNWNVTLEGSKSRRGHGRRRESAIGSLAHTCDLEDRYTEMAERLCERFQRLKQGMRILVPSPQLISLGREGLLFLNPQRTMITVALGSTGSYLSDYNVYFHVGYDYYVCVVVPRGGREGHTLENHFLESQGRGRDILQQASSFVNIAALTSQLPITPPQVQADRGRGFDMT